MSFQIKSYIRFSFYNNQLIVLNLKKDNFLFFNELESLNIKNTLMDFLKKDGNILKELNKKNNSENIINKLISLDLVEVCENSTENFSKNLYNLNSAPSSGAPNLDWKIQEFDTKNKPSIFEIFYCYLALMNVYITMSLFGFYEIIKKLKNKKIKDNNLINKEKIQKIVTALNKAAFFFPIRVKCLEWSITLCIILIKKGVKANLQIGVQNFPFASHAWVKLEDEIIADDNNLSKNLSIILSEPFLLN